MEGPFHSELERRVATYLQQAGYPVSSIVHDPILLATAGAVRYRPDLGVIDPERGDYLALFEIKGVEEPNRINAAAAQLNKYVRALGKPDLPRFVVTPGSAANGLHFYAVSSQGSPHHVSLVELPSFHALRGSVSAATKARATGNLRETTDSFRAVAWVAGAIAVALAAADFYMKEFRAVTVLTAERLTLMGAALALLVLPFAAKLKAFGLEYESSQHENRDRGRDT